MDLCMRTLTYVMFYILYSNIYITRICSTHIQYLADTKATSSPLHRPFDSFLDLKMPSTNGVSGGLLPGDEDSDDGEEEEEEGQNYDRHL